LGGGEQEFSEQEEHEFMWKKYEEVM